MARTTDAAARRPKTKGEAPKANLLEKEISGITPSFVDYIEEQTGYRPSERDVQLASVLRRDFQKSETNQARMVEAKERKEAEAEARTQRAADRAEAKEAREAARAEKAEAKAKAPKAEPKAKPAAKAAPAKTAAKTAAKPAAKATAAKPAAAKPAARRRPAKAAAATEDF